MALVTLCLLSLIPYLSFLFHFISPIRIIGRIRRQAELALEPRRRGAIDQARAQVIEAIEELEDIASGSPDGADRAISMASVDALAELVEHYASKKAELPPDWFAISGGLASDPDFVAMDASALGGIEAQGTWLEVKVLRQYLALLSGSLGRPRGVATLVTLNTRRLAESRAIPVDLSIRFFNSYLRASITGRDARTGYYALSQYRMLAESLMSAGDTEATIEIAGHLRYYGRLGYEVSQPFLLEVVAYDVALLVEQAASEDAVAVDTLLDLLLEIDAETGRSEHEAPIRGVRRAQIQLATFFLERGDDEDRARRIFDDMKHDPTERLELIRNELLTETDPQYREFTDRGVNFAYLAPSRHDALERFFGWLNAEA